LLVVSDQLGRERGIENHSAMGAKGQPYLTRWEGCRLCLRRTRRVAEHRHIFQIKKMLRAALPTGKALRFGDARLSGDTSLLRGVIG
jgi:hypothetical protein